MNWKGWLAKILNAVAPTLLGKLIAKLTPKAPQG
jgi:hypothetical protein